MDFLKIILSSCTNIFGVTYGIHYDDVLGETGLRVRHVDVRAAVEDVDGAVGLADPVLAARAGVLEGPLLEFFEKVQDSPIFILSSLIGLLWTLARDFFKTRTKNTLRLAGLKAKVYTFMLYGMW